VGPQKKVDLKKIMDLKAQGLSLKTIGLRLGHDARTVARALEAGKQIMHVRTPAQVKGEGQANE
jgi:DNA-binding CsgD family transcriptional regulator